MKNKLLLLMLLLSTGAFAQNRLYNLTTQFDSVKVRKLLMTSISTGSATDSILVKKPNGGVFKIARSSFGNGNGTVTSFGKVDGVGITSSVSNPTTTPVYTASVDTTVIATKANSYTLAQMQTKLNSYTSNFIKQSGNSFGATMTIGTNDLNDVNIIRNSVVQATFGVSGITSNFPIRYTAANDGNINTVAKNSDLLGKANLNGTNTWDGSLQTYGNTGTARTYLNNNGLVVGSTTDSKAALVSSTGFGYRSATGSTININFPVSTVNRNVSFQDKDGTVAYTSDLSNNIVRTASGNGSSTTITIAHGLSGVTTSSYVTAMANNAASAGIQYVTVDATNINIFYTVAPVSGTNNLLYSIEIKP